MGGDMKLTHFIPSLCLLLAPCLTVHASAEAEDDFEDEEFEDYEEPADRTYTTEEQQTAFRAFLEHAQRYNTIISEVTDVASADRAVSALKELRRELENEELTAPLSGFNPPPEEVERLHAVWESRAELISKLEEVFFHGSTELSELLGGWDGAAFAPQPATPEMLTVLRALFSTEYTHIIVNDEDMGKSLSSGPGFSRESAWICSSDKRRNLRLLSHLISSSFSCPTHTINEVDRTIDNKVYRVITIDFFLRPEDGVVEPVRCRADLWVDISLAGQGYTPEQREKAIQQYREHMGRMKELLTAAHDKESADAAADYLAELENFMTPELLDILDSLENEQKEELQESVRPDREVMIRLFENKCYGSEKLRGCLF